MYFSLDQKEATNLFDIAFVCDLFEPILGRKYVTDWCTVLTSRPFLYSGPGPLNGEYISFARGIPLGFYGSFGPFALAMHFIQFLGGGGKYCVLGDDYLSGDRVLADNMELWITRAGGKISKDKSYESPVLLEFAKRLLFRTRETGLVEITPFPLSLIWSAEASVALLISALWGEQKKGIVARQGLVSAIQELDARLYSYYTRE